MLLTFIQEVEIFFSLLLYLQEWLLTIVFKYNRHPVWLKLTSSLETDDGLEAVGCHFVRLRSLAQWVRGTCWASPMTWVQFLEPMSRWKARTLVFNISKMFHSHEVCTSENPHFPQHACEYWQCVFREQLCSHCVPALFGFLLHSV